MARSLSKAQEAAALKKLLLPAQDMRWWREARFGLFIHWGLYAIPGRGEWVQFTEKIDVDEYAKLAGQFKPTRFDADEWASIATEAGMKYTVLTTRHHDGFCLFDSPSSVGNFTSVKTAARRDFIAEYVPAVRRAGLGVGFYYSPLDWRFPGYFFPEMYRANALALKKQCYGQVRELLSNYGPIDVLWYDGGEDFWLGLGGLEYGHGKGWHTRYPAPYTGPGLWEPLKLNTMVRKLQPKVVINARSGWEGDFDSSEGVVGQSRGRPWETCMTIVKGGWGFMPDCELRTLKECVDILVQSACGDGNLLLNVGPMPDGRIEPRQASRLREIGQWLADNGRSVYATTGGPVPRGDWGGTTFAGKSLFVHVLNWPARGPVKLPRLTGQILAARTLSAGPAAFQQTARGVEISVPPRARSPIDTVIELRMDRTVTRKMAIK
ncbi:MAG: alpha-L-fucosidase [Planctomycetota bacterium]|nr:alpha-L-fucosidase [Planctomycetota bacterium]